MWRLLANKWVLIVIAIIGGGLTIYFVGRSGGKKKGQGTQAKLPNSGSGIPKGWDPSPIVKSVFDALNNVVSSSETKQKWFLALYNLTDDQLTAVYNEFNRLHQGGAGKDTLYGWIDSEWNVNNLLGGSDSRPQLLEKMKKLKLI